MPVVPLKDVLDRAFKERYGVAAFNIVNDLTLEAVLAAAVELRAPVIVQTSVKTVKSIGRDVLYGMWRTMTAGIEVPVTLHLDHCPEREVITSCLEGGWNSVLFDASSLPVEENQRQTKEVVAEARRYGAHVEGEIEGIKGVEDGVGSDEESDRQSLDVALEFIRSTGIDCFAPAIGNAHGMYASEPKLDSQRVTDIVEAEPIPIALHGGSGMTDAQFADLIARGCAKVNISTALKRTFMKSNLAFLRETEVADKWDPPSLFKAVRADVVQMAQDHIRRFGERGQGLVTALIFDCDGVLADTERDGHLPAFNQMFEEFGLPVRWSEEEYGEKLKISGGKERMASLLTDDFVRDAGLPTDPEGQRAMLAEWHRRKTQIYTEMVAAGRLPGRPGVARIIASALDAGWALSVASTSSEASVRAVLEHVAGADQAARFALVLAGDVVPKKKPAPDIYQLAVAQLGVEPDEALVIEDSRNGLLAAAGADLPCVVTVSSYTEHEDFSEAALVVSSLGDPGGERTKVLANRGIPEPEDFIDLGDLQGCLTVRSAHGR